MNDTLTLCLSAMTAILVSACGTGTDKESYSDVTEAVAPQLTPQNHPHGFGLSSCFQCHLEHNIHVSSNPASTLARQLVAQSGLNSCRGCHGTNGIVP